LFIALVRAAWLVLSSIMAPCPCNSWRSLGAAGTLFSWM
jgi:hypothetical protein